MPSVHGKQTGIKHREAMVRNQIARRGINDTYVLEAMKAVPRELFMPDDVSALAYEDMPAPIGEGQTMSQPYIVAMMTQLAELHPTDKVLEIGTGSGYGAAILSQIAEHVYTVESNEVLARHAAHLLRKLGYDNVTILHGDGTQGYPDEAPFDAIIVTAGAPGIPETLQEQLALGGRLVIPAGEHKSYQHLLQIRRTGVKKFEMEDCGPVTFVPLIGRFGWQDQQDAQRQKATSAQTSTEATGTKEAFTVPGLRKEARRDGTTDLFKKHATSLPPPDSPHFGAHFDELAEADIVLLGESTHGTAEFYRARSAITQRLVRNHGFNVIALEADWPDVATLDGYIRDFEAPNIGQPAFSRFPEWMWRNDEFRMLVDWLKKHNDRQKHRKDKAGLYGLDLYGMQASINAILDFLDRKNPDMAHIARERYGCFAPWLADPSSYGRTVITADFMSCEQEAIGMLMELMAERKMYMDGQKDIFLDIMRNAELIKAAERYYRVMYLSSAESWNLRDRHMFETLNAIMESKGPEAKAIVWAHNSHIGDARATEMGAMRGELNLGQLCREHYGDKVRLVGFGTATGQVSAASHWGGTAETMTLNQPRKQSLEYYWQETGMDHALMKIHQLADDEPAKKVLAKTYLQRAIGVVYRPDTELMSHYFESQPGRQFDYYVWLRETSAVKPLPPIPATGEAETFPFGL